MLRELTDLRQTLDNIRHRPKTDNRLTQTASRSHPEVILRSSWSHHEVIMKNLRLRRWQLIALDKLTEPKNEWVLKVDKDFVNSPSFYPYTWPSDPDQTLTCTWTWALLFKFTFMLSIHRGIGAQQQHPNKQRVTAATQANDPVCSSTVVVI